MTARVPGPLLPMAPAPAGVKERADAQRNRSRILCAAERLVAERGISAISMDDVAAEAGVGKGTLYRRFGDRASLIRALVEEPERQFQEALIRGLPPLGPGAPPAERLHAFGDGVLDFLERHAHLLSAATAAPHEYLEHPVQVFYRLHVVVLLRQLIGPGATTEYLADALLGALNAGPFLYQRRVRGLSLDEVRDGWHAMADAIIAYRESDG